MDSIIVSSIGSKHTRNRIYNCWSHMIQRCTNSNATGYANYGGRGITVCAEWRNSFDSFREYVSQLPHFKGRGHTFDRIENDGNYEPGNVRWATREIQSRNRRVYKNAPSYDTIREIVKRVKNGETPQSLSSVYGLNPRSIRKYVSGDRR